MLFVFMVKTSVKDLPMEFKSNLIVSSAWLLNRSTKGDRISLKLETGKTKVFKEKHVKKMPNTGLLLLEMEMTTKVLETFHIQPFKKSETLLEFI